MHGRDQRPELVGCDLIGAFLHCPCQLRQRQIRPPVYRHRQLNVSFRVALAYGADNRVE